MKKYFASLIALTFLGFASIGSAAVYDFAAEGNQHEAGYETFNSNAHTHAGTVDMPGGLTITASNGSGLIGDPFDDNPSPTTNPYYAYFDANNAGLGVCKATNGNCAGISDDNQMPGEYIHMAFNSVVDILSLDITGNHAAVESGTTFYYSLDSGATWGSFDIGGEIHGTFLSLLAVTGSTWMTDTLDYTIEGGQIYLSALETVSAVPIPAAIWLFGTALIGFISFSRRTKV